MLVAHILIAAVPDREPEMSKLIDCIGHSSVCVTEAHTRTHTHRQISAGGTLIAQPFDYVRLVTCPSRSMQMSLMRVRACVSGRRE